MRSTARLLLIALPLWLGLVACGNGNHDPDPAISKTVSAINRPVTYVNRASYWNTSAVGGDRGAEWFKFPGGDFTGWEWMPAPSGYGETYVNSIPFGADPNNKPTTVYFRTTFYLPDVSAVNSLRLDVMYDDGFVAYINGFEVKRADMPPGPVNYATLATGHEANNSYVPFALDDARPLLKTGNNTLSIEVHQTSPSSSDLVFDAGLVGEAWVAPPPPSHGEILADDEWQFWDRGGELGTAWRESGFDATAWDFGPGVLGYGENYVETPVSFGGDPAHKRITTYFRKQFVVDRPASAVGLKAYAAYDDGMIVYLNGQPVHRASMPAGPVTSETLALAHEASFLAYEEIDLGAYVDLLVQGVNTIAVEVHQADPASSDLVFHLLLGVEEAPPPPAPPSTIARRSSWKYYDQGGVIGDAWRGRFYDDSGWQTGPAPLGYGEDYLQTTVSSGPDPASRAITTYFRRTFDVELPAGTAVTGILGELMFDDGAVIYLNGHEVFRASMPAGPIHGTTLASAHEAGAAYEPIDLTAAVEHIVAGVNVMAVEVHQAAATSSDLVFDLSLDVQTAPQFTKYAGNPVMTTQGTPLEDGWQPYLSAPNVTKVGDGNWVMYYTGNDGGPHNMTGRAVSADGITWTPGADPVETSGHNPSVVFDGTKWHMYLSHVRERGIWYSSSLDGITWTRRPAVMIGSSYEASVLKDDEVFRIWHSGALGKIGYAISTDGVNWTHHPSLVSRIERDMTLIKDGGQFKMWFAETAGLRYATSPDGVHWTARGISLRPGAFGPPGEGGGDWDFRIGRASVVRDAGVLKMWYAGGGVLNGRDVAAIGYATSP